MTTLVTLHQWEGSFSAAHAFTSRHPLCRRMTTLQRSALEPLIALATSDTSLFDRVFRDCKAPLYFATMGGEISANVTIARDLHRRSLPVSPQAFQHSVHNATPGYFSLVFNLPAPTLTISSGPRSFEIALEHARRKLEYGATPPAIAILGADERLDQDQHTDVRLMIIARSDAVAPIEGETHP